MLLNANDADLANLEVVDFVLPFSDLGDAKPGVNSTGDCHNVVVSTFSQPQYDYSPVDFDVLLSAKVGR